MQKILPIMRVIIKRVNRILKIRRRRMKQLLRMALKLKAPKTQESDDTENDSKETGSSSCETSTTFLSKSPCEHCENSHVYSTLIMKCRKCFWHDNYKTCPTCDHQIRKELGFTLEAPVVLYGICIPCAILSTESSKQRLTFLLDRQFFASLSFDLVFMFCPKNQYDFAFA